MAEAKVTTPSAEFWKKVALKLMYGHMEIKNYVFHRGDCCDNRVHEDALILKEVAGHTLEKMEDFAFKQGLSKLWAGAQSQAKLEGLLEARGFQLNDGLKSDIFFCTSWEELEAQLDRLKINHGDSEVFVRQSAASSPANVVHESKDEADSVDDWQGSTQGYPSTFRFPERAEYKTWDNGNNCDTRGRSDWVPISSARRNDKVPSGWT